MAGQAVKVEFIWLVDLHLLSDVLLKHLISWFWIMEICVTVSQMNHRKADRVLKKP